MTRGGGGRGVKNAQILMTSYVNEPLHCCSVKFEKFSIKNSQFLIRNIQLIGPTFLQKSSFLKDTSQGNRVLICIA